MEFVKVSIQITLRAKDILLIPKSNVYYSYFVLLLLLLLKKKNNNNNDLKKVLLKAQKCLTIIWRTYHYLV